MKVFADTFQCAKWVVGYKLGNAICDALSPLDGACKNTGNFRITHNTKPQNEKQFAAGCTCWMNGMLNALFLNRYMRILLAKRWNTMSLKQKTDICGDDFPTTLRASSGRHHCRPREMEGACATDDLRNIR